MFPPVAVANMDVMVVPLFSQNMYYATTHAMFYLVAGSLHVQCLNEMVHGFAVLSVNEAEHKRRVAELEWEARGFKEKYGLLMAEKISVKEV